MDEIADLAFNLNQDGVLVLYSGLITQDVIETVGSKIRTEIGMTEEEKRNVHALFTIFVELAQNVIHHGVETYRYLEGQSGLGHYGMLTLGRDAGHFYVSSASVVQSKDQETLEERLKSINNSSAEEIEAQYKSQRKKGKSEEGDRAGIGLYWVARRTSKPLEYVFRPFAPNQLLFIVKVTI